MNSNGADLKLSKRLNFFTGFFTTAKDWLDGQAYHLEKRKLHNRGLHTPGVIQGEKDNLAVEAAGDLTVLVKAGAALDGHGNLIYLAQSRKLTVDAPAHFPAQVYITLEFDEQDADFAENLDDADFSGYTRKAEQPIVTWSINPPDNVTRLELARIDLQKADDAIKDPQDPAKPQGNEIDRTHVPRAGAVDPAQAERLAALEQALLTHNAAYLERIGRLHALQFEQQRRHNRGLHTPGIVYGIENGLAVVPAGGLTVRVETGLAVDSAGNEVYLNEPWLQPVPLPAALKRLYIVVQYDDTVEQQLVRYLADLANPTPDAYRTAKISVTTAKPDNQTVLELAHVDLEPTATEITAPVNPHHPQVNELDTRARVPAGAVGPAPIHLSPELENRVDGLMQSTRTHFAELAKRFPVPTLDDVRLVALNLKLAIGTLTPEQLRRLLSSLASLELGVEHELGKTYPPLVSKPEFAAYQEALEHLLHATRQHLPIDTILTCQAKVAEAAHLLSLVVFPVPIADAGPDQTVESADGAVTLVLDASGSHAGDKLKIVKYHWEKVI